LLGLRQSRNQSANAKSAIPKQKSPAPISAKSREPNAGLVFLTMTCLSYLVFYGVRENVPITVHPLLFADNSLHF